MSQWLKEHAWKAKRASLTERHQNTSSRNRFNDFPPQNASWCEPVTSVFVVGFEAILHSFYTVSVVSCAPYHAVFVGSLPLNPRSGRPRSHSDTVTLPFRRAHESINRTLYRLRRSAGRATVNSCLRNTNIVASLPTRILRRPYGITFCSFCSSGSNTRRPGVCSSAQIAIYSALFWTWSGNACLPSI
jgi:hypothetical protein